MERKQKCDPKGIARVSEDAEIPIARSSKAKNRKLTLAMVYDIENIRKADKEARRGKSKHYGVRKWDRNREANQLALSEAIRTRTFKTDKPTFEERFCDKKVRVLSKVPYPNHVAHHALMNVIMPVIDRSYFYESAASIKKRGIHYALKHVKKFVQTANRPLWWSQIDMTKCYHNVNRQILYDKLCRVFNDEGIRWMLKDIIWSLGNHNGLHESDGQTGMGIGLYPVQPLVNFDYNDLDREIARVPDCRNFRYCDNILFVGYSADAVWKAIEVAREHIIHKLHQPIHENIGVQRLDGVHPIDFVGYKIFKDHTLIRKETKQRFIRKTRTIKDKEKLRETLSSYKGWLEHADGLHLWQKYTHMVKFSDLNIKRDDVSIDGKRYFDVPSVRPSFLVGRRIIVKDFESGCKTQNGDDRTFVLIEEGGSDYKFCTNNPQMVNILNQVREMDAFPFEAVLQRKNLAGNKINYYFE